MNYKINPAIALGIILVIAALVGLGVWYVGKTDDGKGSGLPSCKKTVEVCSELAGCRLECADDFAPTKSVDQGVLDPDADTSIQDDYTADWQTYRNEKYGFEFKYPVDWVESERLENVFKIYNSNLNAYFSASVAENKTIDISGKEEIRVSGKTGFRYFYQEGAGYSEVILVQLDKAVLTLELDYFGKKDAAVENTIQNIADPILATFKFTN